MFALQVYINPPRLGGKTNDLHSDLKQVEPILVKALTLAAQVKEEVLGEEKISKCLIQVSSRYNRPEERRADAVTVYLYTADTQWEASKELAFIEHAVEKLPALKGNLGIWVIRAPYLRG